MSASVFGWSYPAGCSGPPDDDCPQETILCEKVWQLCEDRGFALPALERVLAVLAEEEGHLIQAEHEAQAEAQYEEWLEDERLDRLYEASRRGGPE